MLTENTKRSDINWDELYQRLYKQVRLKVHQMKLPRWQGEEEDVIWDVVQDSMRKIWEYTRRVEQGDEKPVQDLDGLSYIIALNCLRDRRRREKRLCSENTYVTGQEMNRAHLSEVATENVYQEKLFYLAAQEIAHFPAKQRGALLTDLASRMAFEEKPTSLQAAFRAVGIYLEEYRFFQPENEKERSRHAALLYQSNQRLKDLRCSKLLNYLDESDERPGRCAACQ